MPFIILRQDITVMEVDAIVNAANSQLVQGGGVCGAIFKAANSDALMLECQKLAPVASGNAVITSAYNLPAKHIIHAVGPVYDSVHPELSESILRMTYQSALSIAANEGFNSIAFPLISSGIFGYPQEEAFRIAASEIEKFLDNHEMTIYLTIFDKQSWKISRDLVGDVQSYIDDNYVDENLISRELYSPKFFEYEVDHKAKYSIPVPANNLDGMLENLDEPFVSTLFRYIDLKKMKDVDVYKGANIDRKLFSKIRSNENYIPSKNTILALAISLHLTLDETQHLLNTAGYSLSKSKVSDVIIEYFIVSKNYNIYELNEILFSYDQSLLGS